MTSYKFGQIILVEFPHTDLVKTSKRPAIVIYDAKDQDVVVARVTTQKHETEADYQIHNWKECGLLAESYIRLGKLATIEKQYIIKQMGVLKTAETEVLKSMLKKMLLL